MKKKIILVVGMLSLGLINAKALNGSVIIDCGKKELAPNETTSCTIKGTSDDEITGVSLKLALGDNLTLVSTSVDSTFWYGDAENGFFALATTKNPSGNFDIGSFTIKAGSINTGYDSTVSVNEAVFSSANFDDVDASVNTESIRVLSTIKTLSKISIDGTEIDSFSANTKVYNIDVNSSKKKINITVEKTNDNATVQGDIGEKTLKYGKNTFTITVEAEDLSTNQYTLNVNRAEIRELKTLKVNGTEVDLKSGKYEYTITVENSVTSVELAGELMNSDSVEFADKYNFRKVDGLKEGNNEILIKTKDANNEVLTYKINVNRSSKTTTNSKNVKNPETGINNYLVIMLTILSLGSIAFFELKKHNKFPLSK